MIENLVPSAWQGGYPNQYAMENGIELHSLPDLDVDDQPPLMKTVYLNGSAYRFLKVHIEDDDWTELFYDFLNNTVTGMHKAFPSDYFFEIDGSADAVISCNSYSTYGGIYYYRFVMQDGRLDIYAGNSRENNGCTLDFIAF